MQQQISKRTKAYPKRREVFFHLLKTGRLIGALFTDRRVPVGRKIFFITVFVVLLAVLFFPDLLGELGLSVILPVLGTVLGVPIDAGFDWTAFALLAVNLLHIFPTYLVAEHYNEIFHGE
jgi:hypothetical protein